MSQRRITWREIPKVDREGQQGHSHIKELQASKEHWEWKEYLLQGIAHQLAVQYEMISPENIHREHYIDCTDYF